MPIIEYNNHCLLFTVRYTVEVIILGRLLVIVRIFSGLVVVVIIFDANAIGVVERQNFLNISLLTLDMTAFEF